MRDLQVPTDLRIRVARAAAPLVHGKPGIASPEVGSAGVVHNRFDISPSQRAKLLAAMSHLPEIELRRVTLTPLQRQRLNYPGAV